ncbi:tryptophan 7-halogenase [Cellvibrio sp. PSBB023]|uniref:tryptophan 7-halogenase n=1 Tax=Cellvibrio sp. PSBB023 TaxID=1945512 RepID=UPI0009C3B1AA|nr:tryptophan 7-halogenase [Cellvibrio sp. PSBB023]AQT60506.1 hypothetical protein B0D95_10695 [Cellvibrio sp. PSBB023]
MMSPDTQSLKRIVIMGGGLTGWTAALALAKGLRGLGIDIVVIDHPAHRQLDLHNEATTPACVAFHRWLGLAENELVAATGASFQLASYFNAWSDARQAYFMPYNDHGFMLNRIDFSHYVVSRHLQGHALAYDDYSLAAVAAKRGRFCHPSVQESSLLSTLYYGLCLNTASYANYLREFALHLKVMHVEAETVAIQQHHDGNIASLHLAPLGNAQHYSGLTANGEITADFYLDCSGAQARLIEKQLDVAWQSRVNTLPMTHVVSHARHIALKQTLPSHRELRTAAAGWIQTLGSQTHCEQQYFYHADFTSSELAVRTLGDAENAQVKPLRSGRRASFWYKNCLALGEAAGSMGPLGAGHLHLVQSALLRFLQLLPAHLPAHYNAAEFNRLTHLEYDHIEDFHALHYYLAANNRHAKASNAKTNNDFWQNIHTNPLTDRLAYKLELFKQRGHIPFYEGETFSAGMWTSLLLGNGYWPERTNPLINTMDAHWVEQQLESMKKRIAAAANAMPEQALYLHQQQLSHT